MFNSIITPKDECPYPDLYWAERPYSIIIETSQLGQAVLDIISLLNLLRDQYPEGIEFQHLIAKNVINK